MIDLDIILAQTNPTVGDLSGNFDKISNIWRDNNEADLIVFSETVTTGYPADDLLCRPSFIDSIHDKINNLVEQSKKHNAFILMGTPWKEDGKLYNAALIIGEGKIQHKFFKRHLPNYGVFDDKRHFSSFTGTPDIYELKGQKLGVLICEDMWFKDVAADLKAQGADILISPNGSPFHATKSERRIEVARARVKETGLPLIYVNQIGGQDDLVFDGGSFVMDTSGNITHQLPVFVEHTTSMSPFGSTEGSQTDSLIKSKNDKTTLEQKLYQAVTLGLKDYVHKNGFKGVLIGLSGGIDSALSAAIAVDALGADNVHCVMMPSPYTSQDSLDDAAECAKLLGVKLDTIEISNGMKAFDDMLGKHTDKNANTTTFENIQSRLRGMTLMALSNETGKMVLTTGNKSEMAVGYATLYGDMCGGYNTLKDLYKGQVYALSEWRNTQSHVIPTRIITKAPSAELKPNQTDQDTLPPYDVLDDILGCLIEKEMAIDDIPHDKETVIRVAKMLKRNEYKRRQAPPGPKVTIKAFGRDRRYPITNGFKN